MGSCDQGLATHSEYRVARTKDKRSLPACCRCTQDIPRVAGDEPQLARRNTQSLFNRAIHFPSRFVPMHSFINAELPVKQVIDAGLPKLSLAGRFRIVRESEHTETGSSAPSQRSRNFGVSWQRCDSFLDHLDLAVRNGNPFCRANHS